MKVDPVEQFIDWAQRDRLRSPSTIARYRVVLSRLEDPLHATLEDIEAWWVSRYDMSAATRNSDLACLRSFFKWATKFDHRADDPTRRLDAPKVDNAFPRPIGRSDLMKALSACDERGTPDLRRALALGAYGGLRVAEAAGLDWKNIDMDKRVMYVRGKGRKERIAAISPKLRDEILPDMPSGNVVTAGGHTYSADALQRRVNRHLSGLGIEATFHKLRGRYVSEAIAETGDIYAVSRAVGWSSVETAKSYAALSDDVLHRIAAAAAR